MTTGFHLSSSFISLPQLQPKLHLSSSSSSSSIKPTTKTTTIIQVKMSQQVIEHIVLFKVKSNTDPTKITSFVNGLNGLISIDPVLHLSAGPVHKVQSTPPSPSFDFTHVLHSRYKTQSDLDHYLKHPAHLNLIKDTIDPICDEKMLVYWVVEDLEESVIVPASGSVLRASFLKLKEGLGESEKGEVIGVIGEIKEKLGFTNQFSVGENVAPVKTNGFSIASLAIFSGLSDLEALDENMEVVKEERDKVKEFLESAIVVDYVV